MFMPPGLDADTKNKAAVHRSLVQHGARRTVRSSSHLANVVELLPQPLAAAVYGRHVLHLVAETLVGTQGIDVAVKLRKSIPVLHLRHMVKYHAQCVRTCDVECQRISSALDDAPRGSADTVALVGCVKVFGLVGACVRKYLQREVIVICCYVSI